MMRACGCGVRTTCVVEPSLSAGSLPNGFTCGAGSISAVAGMAQRTGWTQDVACAPRLEKGVRLVLLRRHVHRHDVDTQRVRAAELRQVPAQRSGQFGVSALRQFGSAVAGQRGASAPLHDLAAAGRVCPERNLRARAAGGAARCGAAVQCGGQAACAAAGRAGADTQRRRRGAQRHARAAADETTARSQQRAEERS